MKTGNYSPIDRIFLIVYKILSYLFSQSINHAQITILKDATLIVLTHFIVIFIFGFILILDNFRVNFIIGRNT